jgi:hypothetical protein
MAIKKADRCEIIKYSRFGYLGKLVQETNDDEEEC